MENKTVVYPAWKTVEKYHGFIIVENEFGYFNVTACNCFSALTVASARRAIDIYRQKCNLDENGVPVGF